MAAGGYVDINDFSTDHRRILMRYDELYPWIWNSSHMIVTRLPETFMMSMHMRWWQYHRKEVMTEYTKVHATCTTTWLIGHNHRSTEMACKVFWFKPLFFGLGNLRWRTWSWSLASHAYRRRMHTAQSWTVHSFPNTTRLDCWSADVGIKPTITPINICSIPFCSNWSMGKQQEKKRFREAMNNSSTAQESFGTGVVRPPLSKTSLIFSCFPLWT